LADAFPPKTQTGGTKVLWLNS